MEWPTSSPACACTTSPRARGRARSCSCTASRRPGGSGSTVIPPLVDAGFRVVAPDYRGAGQSWRPAGGYDKQTMAGDIRRLLRDHLGVDGPVVVAGHDIGLMVAYAYAQAYRDEVSQLVVVDAPLPGTGCSTGCAATRGSGTSPSTARATWPRCSSPVASGRTCRPSSTRAATVADRRRGPRRLRLRLLGAGRDARRLRALPRLRSGRRRQPRRARARREAGHAGARGGRRDQHVGALVEEMMREVADDVTGVRVPAPPTGSPRRTRTRSTAALLEFL